VSASQSTIERERVVVDSVTGINAHLDAVGVDEWQHVTDAAARLALADAHRDAGENSLADGIAALVALGRSPLQYAEHDAYPGQWAWFTTGWGENDPEWHRDELPRDWFDLLPGVNLGRGRKNYATRVQAENAAALTFVSLPPARQQEILAPTREETVAKR
jgi:hypothetical protein